MTNRTPYIPPEQAEEYSKSSFVNKPAEKPAPAAPAVAAPAAKTSAKKPAAKAKSK